jgi:putative ABC transport system permease protein
MHRRETAGNHNHMQDRKRERSASLAQCLIALIGVIVPRRFRARFRQEWEAELEYREELLARWDRLDWRNKLELLWRSLGAFWDALWLQPRRLEDEMFQDLRYGTRMLLKNPGFTLIAVLTLALGIGANTAIFSIVNTLLLRPLPYRDPQNLMSVWENNATRNQWQFPVSVPNFQDWRRENRVFADLAVFSDLDLHIALPEGTERIYAGEATANLLTVLGVQPALGRNFQADEEARGDRVILLSHGLWQRMFGGDAEIVGKSITVNNQGYTVIGVLPPGFPLAYSTQVPQAWILLNPRGTINGQLVHQRGNRLNRVVGRLRSGVTPARANEEMNALARRLGEQYPDTNSGYGVTIIPFHEHLVGNVRSALLVLLGAVGFVLLVACVNIANLLLARATARRREIAIRAALGAGRGRVIRQLLTESVLLGLLGGAFGVLLGTWGTDLLISLAPPETPRLAEVSPDGRVLGFTFLLSLATGVLFGLAPALQASKLDLNEALKEGARDGGARNRMRNLLVVAEVALSLILLAGAGLLLRSFTGLTAVNPGFDPRNVLTQYVGLPEYRYAERAQQAAFYEQLLERVQQLPGVEAAGAIFPMVLTDRVSNRFTIEGRAPASPNERLNAYFRSVSSDYFRAMGIGLIEGRSFSRNDSAQSAPVVIINETMARRFWPNESPLGKRININVRFHSGQDVPREIIGVVADVRHAGLDLTAGPEMYTSHLQIPWPWMHLVLRTKVDPASVAPAVTAELRMLDKSVPAPIARTLEERLSDSLAARRFNLLLLGGFAALAVVLSGLGIYSVMAYAVTQRSREIGIRLALGARPLDVLKLVVGQGMALGLIGAGLGLAGAFALTRLMKTLLFGVTPTDLWTFVAAPVLLLSVTLLACYLPARRAVRIDPLLALRHE